MGVFGERSTSIAMSFCYGFLPLKARRERREGVTGSLNCCKTVPFCLIMDASLSICGD